MLALGSIHKFSLGLVGFRMAFRWPEDQKLIIRRGRMFFVKEQGMVVRSVR